MRLTLLALGGLVAGSPAFATLPPERPDYIFRLPANKWVSGERLWKEIRPCNENLCETGFHTDDFVITVDHSYNAVRIVAGFKGCEGASWNLVDLDKVPNADRPAVIRYLTRTMAPYAAEQCRKKSPNIPLPDLSVMFPSESGRN